MQINHIVLNKDLGFQIGFPKSWAVAKSRKKNGAVWGWSPHADRGIDITFVSVDALSVKYGSTLKTFFKKQMRNLNKGWKNYELIKNHQLMFANVSAFEVIFLSEALKDKERLLGRFYSFIAGKRGYNINIGAYGPNHTKYAKDIDAIVKSFKVINNSGGR